MFKKETVIYLEDQNERYARLVIEIDGNVYDIVHTYVSDQYRGKGLAGKLMEEAITYIKSCNGLIKCSCSYASHYCSKHGIVTVKSDDAPSCSLKHAQND